MTQVRRRNYADQSGASRSRTTPGTGAGGGIAPILDRVARRIGEASQTVVRGAAGIEVVELGEVTRTTTGTETFTGIDPGKWILSLTMSVNASGMGSKPIAEQILSYASIDFDNGMVTERQPFFNSLAIACAVGPVYVTSSGSVPFGITWYLPDTSGVTFSATLTLRGMRL